MASRKEEKERLRQERLEREAAEAKAAGRKKRLQLVGGALLGLAAIAAVIAAVAVGVGGGDSGAEGAGQQPSTNSAVQLPEPEIGDLKEAADAAGCELSSPPIDGQNHDEKSFTAADYETNPPTSGDHNPNWYEDGVYNPGDTPKLGELVHTLEHGRIDVQYRPGSPKAMTDQLEAFVAENQGYHMLMFENTTNMPSEVAATAWGQSLTCETMKPEVFDALRTFRDEYLDKGPEKVP